MGQMSAYRHWGQSIHILSLVSNLLGYTHTEVGNIYETKFGTY